MEAVITLTTDFGIRDIYVAAMKGVILSINPQATIVDISHHIEPQNIPQAAFVLGTACPHFPRGTIHLVVVDPGVGTERRALILATPQAFFVAPDNGVLSYVVEEASPRRRPPEEVARGEALKLRRRPLGSELQAIVLSNPHFWRLPLSSTFHGRDLFAPVAAHLSLGTPIQEFGESTASILTFTPLRPQPQGGEVVGHILHIDHFGNLITDVKSGDLPRGKIVLEVAGRQIMGLSSSYAEGGELLALLGSSDRLEISARDKSAATILGIKVGDEVKIKSFSG